MGCHDLLADLTESLAHFQIVVEHHPVRLSFCVWRKPCLLGHWEHHSTLRTLIVDDVAVRELKFFIHRCDHLVPLMYTNNFYSYHNILLVEINISQKRIGACGYRIVPDPHTWIEILGSNRIAVIGAIVQDRDQAARDIRPYL